jgi:hypothetical protein
VVSRPGNAQILFLENSLGAPLFDRGSWRSAMPAKRRLCFNCLSRPARDGPQRQTELSDERKAIVADALADASRVSAEDEVTPFMFHCTKPGSLAMSAIYHGGGIGCRSFAKYAARRLRRPTVAGSGERSLIFFDLSAPDSSQCCRSALFPRHLSRPAC